ncbi:HU family DNA-binding protein [Bacteroides congonensis]|jgi:predicted histone-like DNA-binding protein|uniref:HU family DNA-binding protein n=1 Tax=Bacteroides congonensis TaxID=1871006 RepID=UPI000932DA81|nr:HU family DNA-binding protein [Bacteroides congonensis]
MALKYVVKKTTFGFDENKAEKYVARPFNVVTVDFKMLCDQVTKVGFVPRGTVKSVLDGLIDSLKTYMEIGASVSLGEFGTFRPSFGCKSQNNAKGVTTETLKNRKIIFTPGSLLKGMIKTVSIQKLELPDSETSTPPSGGGNEGDGENGGETPDPAA